MSTDSQFEAPERHDYASLFERMPNESIASRLRSIADDHESEGEHWHAALLREAAKRAEKGEP